MQVDKRDLNTPDFWIPRHPALVRLTGIHPFNCEPPLDDLMKCGALTDNALHYVRNHGYVPQLHFDAHRLQVHGVYLNGQGIYFSMSELCKIKSRTMPVLLVCAGNRRKEQNMVKQSLGFSWGPSALSTAVWTGVSLWRLLEQCGYHYDLPNVAELHVCFEGYETLPKGKYATSVPLSKALDRSSDLLLAYEMNGEKLPPDHGFPLRLIIPGYIGGRMVKWLTKIEITTSQSKNHFHYFDNRVLPTPVVNAEMANEGKWWYKPEYIINELNVNSAISKPNHGDSISIHDKFMEMKGYAYAGGGREIIRVEVSVNNGNSWELTQIVRPKELPLTKYGKQWCWCFWSFQLPVEKIQHHMAISVRAWDSSMNTQPQNLTWNIMGMMNNPWFRVYVSQIDDQYYFEHPTQPGALPGGWMHRYKSLSDLNNIETDEDTCSSGDETQFDDATSHLPSFSMSDVQMHNTEHDCWIVVRGLVYNCTKFLEEHPGGKASIVMHAGTDCTQDFVAIHSKRAWQQLHPFCIGRLNDVENISATTTQNILLKLAKRERASPTAEYFQFTTTDAVPAMMVGQHIVFQSGDIKRAYTPLKIVSKGSEFHFVIRLYEKGSMSAVLQNLNVGDQISGIAPLGHIAYNSKENELFVHNQKLNISTLTFVAAGTGITPMMSLLIDVLAGTNIAIKLLYTNRTRDEVLLENELLNICKLYSSSFSIQHVITRETTMDISKLKKLSNCEYISGRVNETMLRSFLLDSDFVMLCGPQTFLDSVCYPTLQHLGYASHKYAQF